MAPKKTTGAATGEAEIAPRAPGHRSLVTKRDLQAYRRRLEAELADATGEVGFDEEFADARQRVRLR
jgi:hypothetical protein